ncbi:DUF4012 domain-containing protein [Candidatus Peregrinibacteria bacterium]|nr:MAG: DUF4012 domain-containing protein [Candidatus Peregrinibacteria bacterium]
MGSYALVQVNDGKVSSIQTKDVYTSDAQLTKWIPAPAGIDLVADRLYMRDANTSPDFPTSANQIIDLLDYSRGPSVDTVIAVDQTVTETLLRHTGPIKIPRTPFTITAENFNDIMSFYIESKQPYTTTPKQILIDFIPLFEQRVRSIDNKLALAPDLLALIQAGHIQMYSTYESVQTVLEEWGLAGRMIQAEPDMDFLAMISTSVSGNKSDAFIKTDLNHETELQPSGVFTDKLTITKTHEWSEAAFTPWKKWADRLGTGELDLNTLKFIHGAGDNRDFLRIYVPKGSVLLAADGIEMAEVKTAEALNYTVFEWLYQVKAGSQKSVTLTYQLPFESDNQRYRFLAYHQAGAENIHLTKTLKIPDALRITKTYPEVDLSKGLQINLNRHAFAVAEWMNE